MTRHCPAGNAGDMSTQTVQRTAAADTRRAGTLCAAFRRAVVNHPDRVALRTAGDERVVTYAEYAQRVRRTAAGLAALGVRPGDRVALMLTNRPEFFWVDVAIMHLGAVAVGIYTPFSTEQIAHVLRATGARLAVTEQAFGARLLAACADAPEVEHVLSVDGGPGMTRLSEVEAAGAPWFDLDAAAGSARPMDVVTLVHTSGTTGPPKRVPITHANALSTIGSLQAALPAYRDGLSLVSAGPLAHVVARVVEHYCCLALAGTITCCPDPRALPATLVDARPTLLCGPPRVWLGMRAAAEAAIARGVDPIRELGLDRLENAWTAAAPTPPDLVEFFRALGVPLSESYGSSETLVISASPPGRVKVGSVGRPLPGVEVRLGDGGEVLVRTAGAAEPPADGWVRTGDVGELDSEGYLRLVGRRTEMIINTSGHSMSPANIEAVLQAASPLIGTAVCIGDGRPYNTALLVLDPAAGASAHDPPVHAELAAAVDRANARLSEPEQIVAWSVLDEIWLPGGAELTPTLKLRRSPIAQRYAAQIEMLYAGHARS
jgi:long-chain acyl-CoA synthetase